MIKTIYKIACVAVLLCIAMCDARKGSLSFLGDNLAQYEPEIWAYVNQYGDAQIVRELMESTHSERLQVQRLVGYAIIIAAERNDVARLDAWLLAQRPGWNIYLAQALVAAAQAGHVEAVQRLAEFGPNVINWDDGHALRSAARNNRLAVINYLLNNGARAGINAAFVAAAQRGFNSIVERFLQVSNLNLNWNHGQALRLASENGHHPVVETLLTRRFAAPVLNEALRLAARNGYWEIAASLIAAGASNELALSEASHGGHPEIVELLIEHNADIHGHDDSALRGAVERGNSYMVNLLIGSVEDRPADIPPFDRELLDTLIAQAVALRSNLPPERTEQDFTDIITTLRAYRHRVYEQEESEHPAKRRRGGVSPH